MKTIRTLIVYLAFLAMVILIVVYLLIKGWDNYLNLLVELIPELLAALVTFLLIYYFFTRIGVNIINTFSNETPPKWMANAYERYNDIKWKEYIKKSKQIVLIAFYIDSWVDRNIENLIELLRKENAAFVIFLPNYKNEKLIAEIHDLIPSMDKEDITAKIILSIKTLKKLIKQYDIKESKIKVYLHEKPFNYSLEVFDNKHAFLSINEMCRKKEYQSPFIQFDLSHSSKVKSFINDEIKTLTSNSELINLEQWTR